MTSRAQPWDGASSARRVRTGETRAQTLRPSIGRGPARTQGQMSDWRGVGASRSRARRADPAADLASFSPSADSGQRGGEGSPCRSSWCMPPSARRWCFVATTKATTSLMIPRFSLVRCLRAAIVSSADGLLSGTAGGWQTMTHMSCPLSARRADMRRWLTLDRLRAADRSVVKSLRPLRCQICTRQNLSLTRHSARTPTSCGRPAAGRRPPKVVALQAFSGADPTLSSATRRHCWSGSAVHARSSLAPRLKRRRESLPGLGR